MALRILVQKTELLLRTYTKSKALSLQCEHLEIPSVLKTLTLDHFHIRGGGTKANDEGHAQAIGVRSIDLYPLRISVYHMPARVTMKLHDHPSMQVVSFVLRGVMQATHYTRNKTVQGTSPHYVREQEILTTHDICYIDQDRRNLHQFTAIEDTYFLDIIFPDYDCRRPCTYYEEKESLGGDLYLLREVDYQQEMVKLE